VGVLVVVCDLGLSYFGVGFDGDWSFVNFVQGKGDSDQLDGED
jgi:hypothetical protein